MNENNPPTPAPPADGAAHIPFPQKHFTFTEGLKTPIQGAVFLLKRPKLLSLCVAPWLINLVIVLPLVALLMIYWIYPWLEGMMPDFQTAWLSWTEYVLSTLIILALIAMSGALFLLGALILSAPLHDFLGERIEREMLADRPHLQAPPLSIVAGAKHAIVEAVRRVVITIPYVLLALLLGFIPVVGPALVAAANLYIGATFLALDAFSFPMDRRGIPMKDKRAWLRANREFAFGFGLPMLIIPLAFFLMPPLAAASGSMMYCRFLRDRDEKKGQQ